MTTWPLQPFSVLYSQEYMGMTLWAWTPKRWFENIKAMPDPAGTKSDELQHEEGASEKGCKRGHGNRGDISRPGKKLYLRCFLNWILNMNTLILDDIGLYLEI